MHFLVAILVPLGFFGTIFGLLYIYRKAKNKERMALIEKGVDASLITSKEDGNTSLKWSLMLIGMGIGLLLGNLLAENTSMNDKVAYFSMILLFGGGGLLTYYLIDKKKDKGGK